MKALPLLNAKHEAFCQNMAKGMGVNEAYIAAGYNSNPSGASKLYAKPDITIRITQLQTKAAKQAEFTLQDMIKQLDADRDFAREKGAAAAAITASMGKAKVLGMLVDKQEVSGPDGGPISSIKREVVDVSKAGA